jgi:thioredoxin reductase
VTGVAPEPLVVDVVVVGGGPAGLGAAGGIAARLGGGQVLVLEREPVAGGAVSGGALIRTEATVTGWAGPHSLEATTPRGWLRVDARAVVLATGARERPRAARLIPGDRPAGVFTTGQLRRLVRSGFRTGARAVVVGTEPVSRSAVHTLRAAGCRTVLMTTEGAVPAWARLTLPRGVPVASRTRIGRVIGRGGRLAAVEIEHAELGLRRIVACDCLVLTGDWIPDNELARAAGLDLDAGTLGPLTDTAMRTSRPGVFAVGGLVRAAARDGAHVTEPVIGWLAGRRPAPGAVPLTADWPLRCVTPGLLRPGDPPPPRGRLLLWTEHPVMLPRVTVRQDGQVLARRTLPWAAIPGRVFRVPWAMLAGANREGGPIHIRVTDVAGGQGISPAPHP